MVCKAMLRTRCGCVWHMVVAWPVSPRLGIPLRPKGMNWSEDMTPYDGPEDRLFTITHYPTTPHGVAQYEEV